MSTKWDNILRRVDEHHWEIPRDYKEGMLVPGLIFADNVMIEMIKRDQSLEQVANVAFLPGIEVASMAMPDIHWGYGFPVGGVAATRASDGVVSPGGVGFDINCGVRLLRTDLTEEDVRPHLEELVNALFRNIPSGVGSAGKVRLKGSEIDDVLTQGAGWAVRQGLGDPMDLEVTEESGCIIEAEPSFVSDRARKRGADQLGTLGSGNHFLEVQVVDELYDAEAARVMGIHGKGQVTILMHCGSRGFGHQVCDDYLRTVGSAMQRYGIRVPDRQLACVPVNSPEGKAYLGAMRCAANYAWANRQCIAQWARESFAQVFKKSWQDLGVHQVYDVAHNIVKIESYVVNGKRMELCVHRKGATRAFPPGDSAIPNRYRSIGQPVLVPGDMGRYSFLAVGTALALEDSFGSTCHGAGRQESRGGARRLLRGVDVAQVLRERGIVVRAVSKSGLAEEASQAYKDVARVVNVCDGAGISRKVARMRPIGVIKG